MKNIIFILLSVSCFSLFGQGNCLIYPEESGERKACEICSKPVEFSQGSRESQMHFDSAIAVGPKYAWAYYQKSVAYLKRGFLHEGLQNLDKAVELEPVNYLCNRAYWFWQYKNYKLCVRDLETYYALPNAYLQFTPGGEKNMKLILGLAYAKTGDYENAIRTVENHLKTYESEGEFGYSDYHTLGMLYVFTEQFDKAIEAFEKQFAIIDDIAGSYYYLGLAYKGKGEFKNANIQFQKALSFFKSGKRHRIPNPGFPVYKSDVEKEIEF